MLENGCLPQIDEFQKMSIEFIFNKIDLSFMKTLYVARNSSVYYFANKTKPAKLKNSNYAISTKTYVYSRYHLPLTFKTFLILCSVQE